MSGIAAFLRADSEKPMEGTESCEFEIQEKNALTQFHLKDDELVAATSHKDVTFSGTVTWSKASVLNLIQLHKEHQYLFDDPHYKKKSVWEIISKRMQKNGFSYSWCQAENKWKSLTKKYRDAIDNDAKNGLTGSCKCPFYTELSLVYKYTSPFVAQESISSGSSGNTNPMAKNNNDINKSVLIVTQPPNNSAGGNKNKRKFVDMPLTSGCSSAPSQPLATSMFTSCNLREDDQISKKKKEYSNLTSERESDLMKVLHMLQIMHEDRKKHECQQLERLEKMHQEKITVFKDFMTLLKSSVDQTSQRKSDGCTCLCKTSDSDTCKS